MDAPHIGKYRIVEQIGRGGMGTIFKAHDPALDRLVALKVISQDVPVTDDLRIRFFREAKACARLNHPNIVTIHDIGEHDGRIFIVMELLEGQELRRVVTPGTSLTLEDKLSVMAQACAGLHYAHRMGIVHRDIKPSNIFLLPNGVVKILDFGIAQMAAADGLTRTGMIVGTLRYSSPEQVRGAANHRSDIFSLGAVFYELFALRYAFTAEHPIQLIDQLRTYDPPPLHEVDPATPPAVTSLVQRAMRKDPAERFRDLDEMRSEIEDVQRRVSEECQRVRVRVGVQLQRIGQLRAEAARRRGEAGQDGVLPSVEDVRGLAAMQAFERQLSERIAALESDTADDGASRARPRADESDGDGRERERRLAGAARERARAGRRSAAALDAARRAPASWREAVARAAAGEAAWLRKEYASAADAFDVALRLYQQAQSHVREAEHRQREHSARKRREAALVRDGLEAADAAVTATAEWASAEESVAAAEAALTSGAWEEASAAFDRATELFRKAEARAREAPRPRGGVPPR
jgi:hypothetical protein